MVHHAKTLSVVIALMALLTVGSWSVADMAAAKDKGQTIDQKQIDRGRYLARIAGCNDCHTPGYLLAEGKIPEALWLTGESFGWRGPWGTTYAPNLRQYITSLSEDRWLQIAHTLKTRPPMPWFNLNLMHEEDLRAIYHYVRHLGPAGKAAPTYLPPDQVPQTPYAQFPSPPKEGQQ